MTKKKIKPMTEAMKSIIEEDKEFLQPLVQMVVQKIMEAETDEGLWKKTERKKGSFGAPQRGHVTRVGKLELRFPRDRAWRCSSAT